MRVLKFGGTSMGDEYTWQKVFNIIKQYDHPYIIVSATSRTTRQLLAAAEKTLNNPEDAKLITDDIHNRHYAIITKFLSSVGESDSDIAANCQNWIDERMHELNSLLTKIHNAHKCNPAVEDAVASIGERLSSYLFAQCGKALGLPTQWVDAAKIIRTDSNFGKALPDEDFINQAALELWNNKTNTHIPVMGGYYGKDTKGNFTTLGFEGSDYTASLIGAALSADAIEIWTDVSGIYTCDPRTVPDAQPIPNLSFQEATELAYFGAKVLHPSTTKPASQKKIPVYVKNIFDSEQPGTRISHETTNDHRIKAMAFKENCVILTVTSSNTVMGYEFLAGVFETLHRHHMPVDVVTTTEASVSITTENDKGLDEAIDKLCDYGSVELSSGLGIISLVGCKPKKTQNLIQDVMSTIQTSYINLISYSESKGNLNIVLEKTDIIPSVIAIHNELFR